MYYVTDENKNQVDLETALSSYDYDLKTEKVSAVGLTLTIDGIECYCIYGRVNKITTWLNKTRYAGAGDAIFVDKNHDLSYYFTGSDYVEETESSTEINTKNKYGYEWGGYDVDTGITSSLRNSGLSNTNSLIDMDLQPNTPGWYTIWDRIKEFRKSHSDNWFLPSKDELNLVYEARSSLSNLSTQIYRYWSSSERPTNYNYAWAQYFYNGDINYVSKSSHTTRSRLCVQY